MKLTIGFSPCPNDTFIFDALVNGEMDTQGIQFEYVLEDVETLNQYAMDGRLDITKLSYFAFIRAIEQYALLRSGSALGKGVGPLLIAKSPLDLQKIADFKIAIPGVNTTANLLLTLAFPDARNKTALVFNDIEGAVLSGEYDAGLIIHENRFTYAQRGLVKLIDLGEWWEGVSGAAIPLGGIAMKRSFNPELHQSVNEMIRQSVQYSWARYPELSGFVTTHAQEMDEAVMRKHIELYVNDYTTDLGPTGVHAIETLMMYARKAALIGEEQQAIFL
jgi:1,4-dihydroxy-6-naphthoate synthase